MSRASIATKQLGGLAIATILYTGLGSLFQPVAQAQAAYGSYLGAGASVGVGADWNGEGHQLGAVLAARYKFLRSPISLRTQAFISSGSTAIVPTISYDMPLSWQLDAYVGAGYSFATGDKPSPVGDSNSLVIQPGLDYALPNSNTVIFTNAVWALDAYKGENSSALSLQGGLGLRF
ncbi:hypothetical protein NIES970_07740 [[Synechococcus] sp. NIES-970]|uniref:hypothetical protein n=1 Tax=Picosynechococcus sp. NKBG15041c TaxID=1407650 RepID=UPI000403B75E|nr:hypothetical protein [Picosynechococcus sp. NKBG15041c]BAW95860.1 hypothetical protein NIES970_07740 [[Synechococcus] sp. NIES-970]